LNLTDVVPVKPLPLMVTLVPTGPAAGLKLVTDGGGVTVKMAALVAVPPGAVTVILPLAAPVGTVAEIRVPSIRVKLADKPPNATLVAPVKPVPVRLTTVRTGPSAGTKLLIAGMVPEVTVKFETLVASPPEVVTVILPVVAPVGTVAVIRVPLTTVKLELLPLKVTRVTSAKPRPVMVTVVPAGP
jgi:hypothetical protein